MSDVASLELCRELHELSGWEDVDQFSRKPGFVQKPMGSLPLYDLGYLLRKLPPQTRLFKARESTYGIAIGTMVEKYKQFADTPEDAAAKLAIELFKQGILKHE